MRPKHLVSIVLIAVVLVMLMRNNNSMTNERPLVYRESLDEVAAQINDEKLTLRDMAFYVGYEEYQIQQEALVYDPDDPNRYWSMRVEGGFMNAVARKNAMQMALHDELFYQMAMEEGITLDDNDQKHMDNKLEDFWEDLTERIYTNIEKLKETPIHIYENEFRIRDIKDLELKPNEYVGIKMTSLVSVSDIFSESDEFEKAKIQSE